MTEEQKEVKVSIQKENKGLGVSLPLEDLGTIIDICRFLTQDPVREELGIPNSADYISINCNQEKRNYIVSNLYHPTSPDQFYETYSEAELERLMKLLNDE